MGHFDVEYWNKNSENLMLFGRIGQIVKRSTTSSSGTGSINSLKSMRENGLILTVRMTSGVILNVMRGSSTALQYLLVLLASPLSIRLSLIRTAAGQLLTRSL